MTPDDHTASAIEAIERRLAALESEKDLLAELLGSGALHRLQRRCCPNRD